MNMETSTFKPVRSETLSADTMKIGLLECGAM